MRYSKLLEFTQSIVAGFELLSDVLERSLKEASICWNADWALGRSVGAHPEFSQ
jgi:hypothetical protein